MNHHLHEIDAMHTSVENVLYDVLSNGHPVAGEIFNLVYEPFW